MQEDDVHTTNARGQLPKIERLLAPQCDRPWADRAPVAQVLLVVVVF